MSEFANKTNNKLIYPKLSYQIMGILFKVHNKLGPRYQEKYYQRAIEHELRQEKIPYKKEFLVRLTYGDQPMGRYFIDFVIDKKIALEVKRIDFFTRKEWHQVFAYLNTANLKLGILVNFSKPKLVYKRIVNPKVKINDAK